MKKHRDGKEKSEEYDKTFQHLGALFGGCQMADAGLHRMVCGTWAHLVPDTPVTISPPTSTLLPPNCPRKNALPRHSLRGKGGSSTVLRNFHHIWLPAADFSALINLGKMLKVGRAARSLLGR